MPISNCHCRKANPGDPVSVLAKLIYQTDDYIYPTIVANSRDPRWIEVIRRSLDCPGELFCREHIYVAEQECSIVGLACVVPCGVELTFCGQSVYPSPGMRMAINGYFNPLLEESRGYKGFNIANFCVDQEHRGQGIGKKLMQYLIAQLGSQDLHLDVIADNTPAIRVYQSFGFETVSEYYGFSGSEAALPCLHMVRPGK